MPRLVGVREKRDHTLYDTRFMEPGQRGVCFFGATNVGHMFRTNLQIPGETYRDHTWAVLGVGVRAIGKTRRAEDQLLDHLHFSLRLGGKGVLTFTGTEASMLRHLYSDDELEKMTEAQNAAQQIASRCCYLLPIPIVIPARQTFRVVGNAAPELPEGIPVRVYLFGLLTRDIG